MESQHAASRQPRFLAALERGLALCGVSHEARILVGVSGGADSVALVTGLQRLADSGWGLSLVVAHFDHGLRGEDSRADANWVRELARKLGLPYVEGRGSGEQSNSRVEESARRQRYDFFATAAAEQNCPFVAIAQTADDQAETVLHHVLRGSGLAGMRGIPRVRPLGDSATVIRPILDVDRFTVLAWLQDTGADWRTDATNAETRFTRNRIRHQILPLLADGVHPEAARHLCQLAEQAAEWEAAWGEIAERIESATVLSETTDSLRLRTLELRDWPDFALAAVAQRLWKRQGWPRREMGRAAWLRWVSTVREGGIVDFPGWVRLTVDDHLTRLERRPPG
ncbi:MAG: tRNA lysidine(34) synthetase TilS [Planctomycetaceae bacterium]|nr:tRNA lysidine(34) synthetase TilS [Planctomycetaceae bacterium]